MNEINLLLELESRLTKVTLKKHNDFHVITLPFTDYLGDPIEAGISVIGNEVTITDLGRVSGAMFTLGQQAEDTAAFCMVRNLAETYNITMDFNTGKLKQSITSPEDLDKLVNFLKVISTIQISLPELKQRRPKIERSKLVSKLGRDIKRLNSKLNIERQSQAIGKDEIWPVTFKYELPNRDRTEILIITADLSTQDPRQRAANVVTSAMDLMKLDNRTLRVIYEVDGIGRLPEVQRARSLIDQHQEDFAYQTFNYADIGQKEQFLSITRDDLIPLI